MEYSEYSPAQPLRRYVRCYWALRGIAPDDASSITGQPALPDGSPELIYNFSDPFEALNGRPKLQPAEMLVGQIDGPFHLRPTGTIDLIGVRFEPYGAGPLHPRMSSLTNTWLDLVKRPDPLLANVRQDLSRASDDATRVAYLDEILLRLTAERPEPDARVETAVRAIRSSFGTAPLDRLAKLLDISPRTLQRLFATEVGVSPKLLARITRFQRVFSAWNADPRSLSRVATECGYFDQSHLIRDFRDFAGEAPAAFLANHDEFTAFFLSQKPRQRAAK